MKKIITLIAILAIVSCKQEAKIDYAILSGKITNTKVNKLTFNNTNSNIKEIIKVTDEGEFKDTLSVTSGYYILSDGKNKSTLYLEPGNEVTINFDASDFENTLELSGPGSEISNYLISKNKKFKELIGTGTDVYLLEETAYKTKFNEIKTVSEELLEASEGISEDFKEKEKRNIYYSYLSFISKYELYHSHYAKKKDFKVSDEFLNELETLDYNNEEDFIFSKNYENLVNTHYQKEAKKLAEKESIPEDIAYLKVAANIPNETIKNKLVYVNSIYGITYTTELEEFYSLFMAASTNEANKKEITESYNKLKTVAKGQPSPKFENYENFNGGTTSLDDLKGKFVYVDVWATWCGPCIAEIPSLKEVEAKYHNKNIEFVSISVDAEKDYEKWKTMVEEEDLKGIQLFSDKSWKSDFVTGYLIKGIPRFILIDPNGNIVNSNAPRPSSEKLIELFDENNI
ncbi:TlpA family protein disulfide reductase [Lutibacter sp. A80]|uniref:TlpA family protein disulfide reductase n=1 Tax=Lutibacter sp. A80 TaxID=2918453 RepID=UPI001F060833|nr:TlpA disulfide reductase family protein [Lutibacter sp. A80]UMB60535.1 TlpA family protein disulfide reductase [Lutibacter sp. A80]